MSAICGIFNLNKNTTSLENSKNMMDKLKFYAFDYIDTWSRNEIFFGCGIQYITPESKFEKLPSYDENSLLSITADAIIDNREELFIALNISQELWSETTDSDLILRAYIKWGKECPRYLVGDFSFAIWDEKKKELFCARDHTGTRTFYYYYSKETFAFCTLMKPLLTVSHNKIGLNEKWITDFLALPLTLHQCECSETIYESIYELSPATSITINTETMSKNKFWNPLEDVKPLKLRDDKAYEEAFRKIFFEAVRCRLRSSGEIGIMLSGGMDSGSVACVAAKQLHEQNKNLKAYSSIPMVGYKNEFNKYVIPDESEYIETIKREHDNLDLKYCRSEGKNSITEINYILKIFEQPHKIIENMFWYNEIMGIASKENCKIMLNGQFGNYTISYGDFMINMVTLYRKKKIFNMVKEISAYGKIHKVSRKKLSKAVFKAIIPYKFMRAISVNLLKNAEIFDKNLVDEKLADKWEIKQKYLKCGYYSEVEKYYNIDDTREFMLDPVLFSQIASLETKFSLANGMVERDPTRDLRLIEFCLSIPCNQFVRNGQDRYLIRRALEDILPDKIRLNIATRGFQSADWIQRLENNWEEIHKKLSNLAEDKNIVKYVDMETLKINISELGNTAGVSDKQAIRNLLVIYIFGEFLNNYINSK